jgi:hypothetical protein
MVYRQPGIGYSFHADNPLFSSYTVRKRAITLQQENLLFKYTNDRDFYL